MSSEHNKAVVRKAIDALSRGDMAGFLADAADDVSFTLIGSTPLSGTIRGKNTIEQGLTTILGERLEGGAIAMTIENLIADGEYVAEQAKRRIPHPHRQGLQQYLLSGVADCGREDSLPDRIPRHRTRQRRPV